MTSAITRSLASAGFPWLLYAYPWMPFPRRIIIFLREKNIPPSLVSVVRVSDPGPDEGVVEKDKYPPRPKGSLPILVIPSQNENEPPTHIRQSLAIIKYLDELCDTGEYGFPKSPYSLMGNTPLERARTNEVLSLAEELTVTWNPVRLFGTGAGPFKAPNIALESLKWARRSLLAVEALFADRDVASLAKGGSGKITMADIVLYQYLEFIKDCYGKDMTLETGKMTTDTYGRPAEEKYDKLKEFFKAFATRDSAKRVEEDGEVPGGKAYTLMTTWHEGAWDVDE